MPGLILLDLETANLSDSNPPGKSHTDTRTYLYFDQNTAQRCTWSFYMPDDFSSGLQLEWQGYAAIGADDVKMGSEVMAVTPDVGQDVSTTSFDAQDSSVKAVPGTVGHLFSDVITCANDDGVAAGDYVAVRLERMADDAADDANGLLVIWTVIMRYTSV